MTLWSYRNLLTDLSTLSGSSKKRPALSRSSLIRKHMIRYEMSYFRCVTLGSTFTGMISMFWELEGARSTKTMPLHSSNGPIPLAGTLPCSMPGVGS